MGVQNPTVYVNGVLQDGSHIYTPFSISHGRSNPNSQPDAPSLNIVWDSDVFAPALGDTVTVMAPLPSPSEGEYDDDRVYYDDPMMGYDSIWITPIVTRFTGEVTESNIDEESGFPTDVNIVAVNKQANLGRVDVLLDRPAENEIARIQAIADAAGVPITILGNAGPMLAPDTIDKDALGALQEVCLSSGGLVWSNGDGTLVYGCGDHRKYAPPVLAISADNIASGLDWKSTVADLINKITITWGPENAQTEHTLTYQESVDKYGKRYKKVSTMLNEQVDADYTAQLILARRAFPFSRITDVLLDSEYVASRDVALRDFFLVNVSDAALLPIPPDPGPAGILAEWIIEGWQEDWETPNHVILQIAVSDRARFALTTLRSWEEAAANSWQTELDNGAWLDALINSPTVGALE